MYKVYCIHPLIKDVQGLMNYLHINNVDLKDKMVWEKEKPEYVFVSEHIFLNRKYYNEFRKLEANSVKIYIAGESISPDLNLFDYAIVLDKGFTVRDRVVRIPPMLFHESSMFVQENNLVKSEAKKELRKKSGFCCFIYSNKNAHPTRDKLFFRISEYKKVDSLGKHLRNVNAPEVSDNWRKASIELKNMYKFSIAAENARFDGYTSEKIFTSLQAHSIPIYWGNPSIEEEINPKAFINANKFETYEDLINEIKSYDEDDDKWLDMVCEPWQTEEQKQCCKSEEKQYYEFIQYIFNQNYESVKRIPEGTYPKRYLEFFGRGFGYKLGIKYSRYITIARNMMTR